MQFQSKDNFTATIIGVLLALLFHIYIYILKNWSNLIENINAVLYSIQERPADKSTNCFDELRHSDEKCFSTIRNIFCSEVCTETMHKHK